jgi:hypothetical protein
VFVVLVVEAVAALETVAAELLAKANLFTAVLPAARAVRPVATAVSPVV